MTIEVTNWLFQDARVGEGLFSSFKSFLEETAQRAGNIIFSFQEITLPGALDY